MWMGGTIPLGYTAQDRKLVVSETEANIVRTIFTEFLRVGSVHSLQDCLRANNITNRRGHHFFRGPLYTILHNSHYLGWIKHKKEAYPGEHPAIIDRNTWDKVQTLLDDNLQGKRRKVRVTRESLVTSIVFDEGGTLYTPTHAKEWPPLSLLYFASCDQKNREERCTGADPLLLTLKRQWLTDCSNGCEHLNNCLGSDTTVRSSTTAVGSAAAVRCRRVGCPWDPPPRVVAV
ncbi:MAG: recombinase family protein [Bryocella sp.]